MKDDHAKILGALFQAKRVQLGYSIHDVASAAGVTPSTVLRIEQGQFTAPRPDKLVRFAKALDIHLADVYASAGYVVPKDLPSFGTYLRAKYPKLPMPAVAQLVDHFNRLLDTPKP